MRLDEYVLQHFQTKSKTNAQDKIKSGRIFVDGKQQTKCGQKVSENAVVTLQESREFVSKGGLKLEKGIADFDFSPEGKVFVDVGASNGGFTHCLLSRGAKKVYAVDVGENQLDESLRRDERVVVLDKTNARNLTKEHFAEGEIYVVSDVSFISITLIIPALATFAKEMLLLIKPQFECGKKALNKNGVVTNPVDVEMAKTKVIECGESFGYTSKGITDVSHAIQKNKEFMVYFTKK